MGHHILAPLPEHPARGVLVAAAKQVDRAIELAREVGLERTLVRRDRLDRLRGFGARAEQPPSCGSRFDS
jgi:hypothetical protein